MLGRVLAFGRAEVDKDDALEDDAAEAGREGGIASAGGAGCGGSEADSAGIGARFTSVSFVAADADPTLRAADVAVGCISRLTRGRADLGGSADFWGPERATRG